jgi:hypothetical protein
MSDLDIQQAHHHFSTHCFNQTWTLIDQESLTKEETERMLHLAHASFWHWSQRPDNDATKRSVGYWQLARVYTLAQQAERANYYAERCQELSKNAGPFYLGYAYEALARAARLSGDDQRAEQHAQQARKLAKQISDVEDRAVLLKDLDTLDK